jgi:hypothetical protein
MASSGWREGRNLVTQVQWWNDQPEQMSEHPDGIICLALRP